MKNNPIIHKRIQKFSMEQDNMKSLIKNLKKKYIFKLIKTNKINRSLQKLDFT